MLAGVRAAARGILSGTSSWTRGTGYFGTALHSAAIGGAIGGARGALDSNQSITGGAWEGAKAGALWGAAGRGITGFLGGKRWGTSFGRGVRGQQTPGGWVPAGPAPRGSYWVPGKMTGARQMYRRPGLTIGGATGISPGAANFGYGMRVNPGRIGFHAVRANQAAFISMRTSYLTGAAAGLFGSSRRSKNDNTIRSNMGMGSMSMGAYGGLY